MQDLFLAKPTLTNRPSFNVTIWPNPWKCGPLNSKFTNQQYNHCLPITIIYGNEKNANECKKYIFSFCIHVMTNIYFFVQFCSHNIDIFLNCGLVIPYGKKRSGSTLVQVMAFCMMPPCHYLIRCWFIINRFYGIYMRAVSQEILLWPLLLTWFNFDTSMDK